MEDEGNNLKRKLSTENAVDNDHQQSMVANLMETNDEHATAYDETDHLRQFDVLDEVQGDDSGSENGDNEQKGKNSIEFLVEFRLLMQHVFIIWLV